MTDTSISIDSEFQSLIPPLTDDEYRILEESILAEGLRHHILTWNGVIVDGHNRYRICQEHGIEIKTAALRFDSRDAAKIWIINNQFGRRNLSSYDRSVLALQLEALYAAEAKRRMSEGGNSSKVGRQNSDTPLRTDDQLAKLAGTSRDTIRKVKAIETEAAKGNETAIEAREDIRSGRKSIHRAFTEMHKDSRSGSKGPQYTDDGRRICSICGKPIENGEHFQDKLGWCKECGRKRHTAAQRRYRDADHDLRENVATYTIDSLLAELSASADSLRSSWTESIEINESMGVNLTRRQKSKLNGSINRLFKTIQEIRKESTNG